jgi:ABC-2 type transport system ATP-binding protein
MRQRLGIAQALLHKPALLILDEPTNGLDPAGIHEMREYLRKITVEEGVSILISSHLLSEIEQLCGRVVVIQNGRLVTVQTIGGTGRTLRQDGKDSAAPIVLSLRVTDPALTQQVLGPLAYVKVQAIDTAQSTVAIEISDRDVPAAVAALAAAQVGIFRIAERAGSSLEDEFLKWTGGNRIA